MTSGPYTVDNMLYASPQGLRLSHTEQEMERSRGTLWTQVRKQSLKPAEAGLEVSTQSKDLGQALPEACWTPESSGDTRRLHT